MKASHKERYLNPDKAKKRLFFWLLIFFMSIALPVYFLLHKVYSQLENEIWYTQRSQAELLVERIERQLLEKLQAEQDRPIAEYSFFNVLENPLLQSTTVNLSPLSEVPPKTEIPGLIGYFQIHPDGSFHIPGLPELNTDLQSGLSTDALAQRIALKEKLHDLLTVGIAVQNQVAAKQDISTDTLKDTKASAPAALQAPKRLDEYFQADEQDKVAAANLTEETRKKTDYPTTPSLATTTLNEEKVQQLDSATKVWQQKRKQNIISAEREKSSREEYNRPQARKETVKIPDQSSAGAIFNRSRSIVSDESSAKNQGKTEQVIANVESAPPLKKQGMTVGKQVAINILSFESEVSPLQRIALDGRYLCFYRNAWHGKSRYIQGFIVDERFLQQIIQPILDTTHGLLLNNLLLVDNGKPWHSFKINQTGSELLVFHRALLPPFQHMEIRVNSGNLSASSSKQIVNLVSLALALMMPMGFILFYRLGAGQIELAKQQRNFISAVSHELKTPLTSIRMYSEMLRSNWITHEERKQSYYDYIYFESERLSRLISNVLQLARLDNQQSKIQWTTISANVLLQQTQARVAVQIEAAHYQLQLILPETDVIETELTIDLDAFFQIMINLVDNAIKFSRSSNYKTIDMGYSVNAKKKALTFFVRDYGPGVEKEQMKKIFRLFYRAGDELTRTQPGTGIGLALVTQLAHSMGAVVDLVNRSPGAEFQVKFILK